MGQTPNHAFPYPELTDPADVPADVRALAEAVDAAIPVGPVIPPGEGGFVNIPILDIGVAGQNRAGRQLTATDFTQLGLGAPLGLWNLSSTSDASGAGRNLVNKGTVPFGVGINGLAATSAVFAGSATQALYIDDTGVNDPLRIRTGSWGCWMRTAKRGLAQTSMSKWRATITSWAISADATNVASVTVSTDGSASVAAVGVSDVCDNRWHQLVATYDGTVLRLYVDAVPEAIIALAGTIFSGGAPLNIGGYAADASTATLAPSYGRVDEAFMTADVLTEDQVRSLYCARLAHLLGITPGAARINVHRRRRGTPLTPTDFATQPLRLHNFTAGSLADQGSGNVTLVSNPGTGAIVSVAGADGVLGGAYAFSGAHTGLSATDSGLPGTTAPRSYGAWVKTTTIVGGNGFMGYGAAPGANDMRFAVSAGLLIVTSGADTITGPLCADGQWHLAVAVDDNAAGDGVRRKLYLDGRLVGASTVLSSITLTGANRFRVGAFADGTAPFTGQIDGAFICGYALNQDEVLRLYAKASQDLGASPKEPGPHVERLDATGLLWIADTLEPQHTVDLGVVA